MRAGIAVALVALAGTAVAADVVIYDESLGSGFVSGYSYGGTPADFDFASTTQAHQGTHSVAFRGDGFNAVAFANENQSYPTSTYPVLHFWIHGGTAGGQNLQLFVYSDPNSASVANVPLAGYVAGGSIAANAWREVTVPLTQPPLNFTGSLARFDLQNETNTGLQPWLYLDEVHLQQAAVANDPIFANGFEGGTTPPPAPNGLVIDHDVTVSGMSSDRFTWRDAANHPRVAVLAHNDTAPGPGGSRGGALREYRYQMPDTSTRVAGVTNYGNGGYGGFGYIVSHSANGNCAGDDSPLGFGFPGTFTRVFEGRHHAIFRFTQNYPRNCSPNPPATSVVLPVTVDWVFATGHDHPLWAVTYDMSAIAADFLYDDSRAPYGELEIDGDGSTDISGVAWGDAYAFTSTTAPVTLNSSWTWTTPNTIPYVKEWITSTDATMGVVATQTLTQHDAGAGRNPFYHDLTPYWGTASGAAQPFGGFRMPWQDSWPYQANSFSIGAASNNNARLTWGTQYGFLGQQSYAVNTNTAPGNNGPNASGWPRQSYSTYIVLGPHSADPIGGQVKQVEAVQGAVITATIGSVATSGLAGVNRPDTASYQPAGWNAVYGALTFDASGNRLDANVSVPTVPTVIVLRKPLVILRNCTAYPSAVRLNGTPLAIDVDYFPSLRSDAAAHELWITLNRDLSGATNHLEIVP